MTWGGTYQNAALFPPYIGVARIFVWGGPTKNHMQGRHQEFLKEELFVGQRYRTMEDQKPWPSLALYQEFSKARRLKPELKNDNI